MEKVTYYIAVKQKEQLKTLSMKMSISVGALIRLAINDFLEKNRENLK